MGDDVLIYRGYRPDNPAGGRLVVIVMSGEVISPLPHRVKHAPDGLSWGYSGSGPADLARSLLIHALGKHARCESCNGTGHVVYTATLEDESANAGVPFTIIGDPEPGSLLPWSCPRCDQGYTIAPIVYQQFKDDVVANLPQRGWAMTRGEILHWFDQHADIRRTHE
jgi:hypothetical protein